MTSIKTVFLIEIDYSLFSFDMFQLVQKVLLVVLLTVSDHLTLENEILLLIDMRLLDMNIIIGSIRVLSLLLSVPLTALILHLHWNSSFSFILRITEHRTSVLHFTRMVGLVDIGSDSFGWLFAGMLMFSQNTLQIQLRNILLFVLYILLRSSMQIV